MNDIKIIEPDEWVFIFEEPNNGWWLKISNANDLIDYHNKTVSMYQRVISDYANHKEEYEQTGRYDVFKDPRTYAVLMFGQKREITILDACIQFRMEVAQNQLYSIHEEGFICINKNGGWHGGDMIQYSQFVRRKTFIWPDFKESDIRISRFPGGAHWYVHIGDMELHEGNNIKWNTEKQARDAAMRYVGKENV